MSNFDANSMEEHAGLYQAKVARYLNESDVFGVRNLFNPPASIREADQVRREPNAPAQWVAGLLILFGSTFISGGAVLLYHRIINKTTTDLSYLDEVANVYLDGTNWVSAVIMLGSQALASVILYWLFIKFIAKRPVYEIGSEGAFKEFGLGLLLGTLSISTIVGIIYAMGGYKVDGLQFESGIILALFIGIGPAFAEEVVFRGIALRLLDKAWGSWLAIIVSSLVFGLMHAGNPYVTFLQALLLGVGAGFFLGAAYLYTRRLWLVIGLHLAWNFVQGGIYNSDVSGNGFSGGLLKASFEGPEWLTGGKMGMEGSIFTLILCLLLGGVFMFLAHRKGNLNPRIGSNAPRISLEGSLPRIQIWSLDGGWKVIPRDEDLSGIRQGAPAVDNRFDSDPSRSNVAVGADSPTTIGGGTHSAFEIHNEPYLPPPEDSTPQHMEYSSSNPSNPTQAMEPLDENTSDRFESTEVDAQKTGIKPVVDTPNADGLDNGQEFSSTEKEQYAMSGPVEVHTSEQGQGVASLEDDTQNVDHAETTAFEKVEPVTSATPTSKSLDELLDEDDQKTGLIGAESPTPNTPAPSKTLDDLLGEDEELELGSSANIEHTQRLDNSDLPTMEQTVISGQPVFEGEKTEKFNLDTQEGRDNE